MLTGMSSRQRRERVWIGTLGVCTHDIGELVFAMGEGRGGQHDELGIRIFVGVQLDCTITNNVDVANCNKIK